MVTFTTLYISISGSGAIRFPPFHHSIEANDFLTDFIVKKLELCGAREHGLLKVKGSTPCWQHNKLEDQHSQRMQPSSLIPGAHGIHNTRPLLQQLPHQCPTCAP